MELLKSTEFVDTINSFVGYLLAVCPPGGARGTERWETRAGEYRLRSPSGSLLRLYQFKKRVFSRRSGLHFIINRTYMNCYVMAWCMVTRVDFS